MHPTESEPESIHEPDAQTPEPASPEETDERPSHAWWQKFTSRWRQEEAPQPEEPAESAEPQPRMVTDEELQRLIQSEADKREAARNKAARDEERKRLRDEDPWALAELERQEEQTQEQQAQLDQAIDNIARFHDSLVLEPLVNTLDPAERERLMKLPGAGVGADGRKLLATEALKSLEKHWRAEGAREAEAKLRRNPAFRKQVMSELSGDVGSPELLPSGSSATPSRGRGNQAVNDFLRQQIGVHKSL